MNEERKIIKIVDEGEARYCLKANFEILGRMWDNEGEEVVVVKPESESESLCVMIVTSNGKVVDHIVVEDEPVKITNNLSQYSNVKIGFSFSRADGYVKNSEILRFYFLKAQKPDGFVPVESEQIVIIEQLARYGFAKAELQNNELVFFTMNGSEAQRVQLSGFVQEQSDLSERDEIKETFVKGKKTSNLENDGDGSSPFATIKQLYEIKSVTQESEGVSSTIKIDNTGYDFSISTTSTSGGEEITTKTSFSGSNISVVNNDTQEPIRPTINNTEAMAYLSDIDSAIRVAISDSWVSEY